MGSVSVEVEGGVWASEGDAEEGGCSQSSLELGESIHNIRRKVGGEGFESGGKGGEGGGDGGVIFNKTPVEIAETEETADFSDGGGGLPVDDG